MMVSLDDRKVIISYSSSFFLSSLLSDFKMLPTVLATEGIIIYISKDRVKPSPLPDGWKLKEIFATGIVFGVFWHCYQ